LEDVGPITIEHDDQYGDDNGWIVELVLGVVVVDTPSTQEASDCELHIPFVYS
jgi:hypothetical protein